MKKIKKIVTIIIKKINLFLMLFLVFVLLTNSLIAQVKVGVSVGLNNSKAQKKDYFYENSNNSSLSNSGIKIGGFVEFEISPKFYIQSALNYDQKPTEVNFGTETYKQTPQYLEIPVNIKYVLFSFPNENKLSVIVGPYFAFGIGGEQEYYSRVYSSQFYLRPIIRDLIFGNGKDDDLSPIDIGLNFGLDYDFRKFQLKLQYQLGLSNTYPSDFTNENPDISEKNTNISFSFGYYIF